MQAAIASVLSKALRTAGQGLDAFGRGLEVMPYIEKREFRRGVGPSPLITVVRGCFPFPTHAPFFPTLDQCNRRHGL